MKTIHLIASAHLDPIWLWPWQNGMDAVLNTCRTMVSFLGRHPEVIFTCGEAWKYRQLERLAPGLFGEIKRLVASGRWEIVGGWWIQPDCNAPSGFALERQIELGVRYFRETFGQAPHVAYNVDSFGHAATLPGYMRAAGQSCYVMMRPQEGEMGLPARLFRWRGYEGDEPVTTFRIAGGYGDFNRISEAHVRLALTELPEGVDHTMCFLGVGDHGGGPNERLMRWLEEHRAAFADVNLVWSSPSRFFAAIAGQAEKLPVVTGELQHHAVGCYSVYRPVKVAVRRAEHLLAQAETLALPEDRAALDESWRTACFHHFHDTLGGTCIPSAYGQVHAQLGAVQAHADSILQANVRKRVLALAPDRHQRIVLHNASDKPFSGYVGWEYWWTDAGKWEPHWRFLDERGEVVPHQAVTTEAVQVEMQSRFVFRAELAPGETRALRLDRAGRDGPVPLGKAVVCEGSRASAGGAWVDLEAGLLGLGGRAFPLPRLDLIPDATDTWSHGVDRYLRGPATAPRWAGPTLLERGPLMGSLLRAGRVGDSHVQAEYRVFREERYVELCLRVEWVQHHEILKLVVVLPGEVASREDGIPGGSLARAGDGAERPVRDFTLVRLANGTSFGVACPDVFALDASGAEVRLTLLRGALMAHHDPAPASGNPNAQFADTGFHEFRFRFFAGDDLNAELLDRHATAMQRPPLVVDTTDGMPPT